MGWFYRAEDQSEIGPTTTSIVRKLAEIGTITPMTMMRREGSDRWFQAKRIKGLFGESEDDVAVATAVREPRSTEKRRTRRDTVAPQPSFLSRATSSRTARSLLAVLAIVSLAALVLMAGRMMTLDTRGIEESKLALWELYGRSCGTAWLAFVIAVAGLALSDSRETE